MTEFDRFERAMWAGSAHAYRSGFATLTARVVDPLLDAAGVTAEVRVLDVGTGPGTVAAAAAQRGARVAAVDAEFDMAALAHGHCPVAVATLPVLPFAAQTFEAVTGNFVINHVGDPPAAARELRRMLRPGSRCALSCWPFPPDVASSLVNRALRAAEVPWPDDIPQPPFVDYGHPDAFAELLRMAGFAEVTADEIRWRHVVDPEQWWRGPLDGVGSTGVVINRLRRETLARVKAAYDEIAAGYATGTGQVSLPVTALLASGTA